MGAAVATCACELWCTCKLQLQRGGETSAAMLLSRGWEEVSTTCTLAEWACPSGTGNA